MKHYESLYEIYISFPFDFGVKYDNKPFTPCQMICSGYRINIPIAQISFFCSRNLTDLSSLSWFPNKDIFLFRNFSDCRQRFAFKVPIFRPFSGLFSARMPTIKWLMDRLMFHDGFWFYKHHKNRKTTFTIEIPMSFYNSMPFPGLKITIWRFFMTAGTLWKHYGCMMRWLHT